ncbi:hypothetical protein [Paraburkholderia sediminicola]|uniref:hypothetical protein n=1 Tax=Paraburkholderia sediminicola TaxID=458836 RepID=UPI0038BB007C
MSLALISVMIIGAKPSEIDVAPFDIKGVARVDQNDVHPNRAVTSLTIGDKGAMSTIYWSDDVQALLQEMLDGQTLRLKLTVGTADYDYSFALSGFATTLDLEGLACSRASAATVKPKPPIRPRSSEKVL